MRLKRLSKARRYRDQARVDPLCGELERSDNVGVMPMLLTVDDVANLLRTSGRAVRSTHPPAHVLFASGDARSTGQSDSGTRRASGFEDDASVHARQPGGSRGRDPIARRIENQRAVWQHVGNGFYRDRKLLSVEQVRWWRRRELVPLRRAVRRDLRHRTSPPPPRRRRAKRSRVSGGGGGS